MNYFTKQLTTLCILLGVFCYADLGYAKPLLIGVIADSQPFTYYKKNETKPVGIGIELWEEMAKRLNINDYKYIPLDSNYNQHLMDLSHGKYDLIVSPVCMTSKRYQLVDFAVTISVAPTVVLLKKNELSLLSAIQPFLHGALIYCLLGYLAVFLIYTHLLWYLERGITLPEKYREFSDRVIWTQLIYGKLETLPQRIESRTLCLIWKIIGYALLSILISLGAVTMVGFTSHLFEHVTTIEELRKKRIAGEVGSQEYENIKLHGINPFDIHDINEGFQLIRQDKLDGIAMNKGEAEYFLNQKHLNDEFYISQVVIGNNIASFPLMKNSPLLQKINKTILELQAEGYTSYVCSKYLIMENALCIGN